MSNLINKGRGILTVSPAIWEELGKPESPEDWHIALLLPAYLEVEQVEQRKCYELTGISEVIPVREGMQVNLIYTQLWMIQTADLDEVKRLLQQTVAPSHKIMQIPNDEGLYCVREVACTALQIAYWDGKQWQSKEEQI